jgi:hypothetical protein
VHGEPYPCHGIKCCDAVIDIMQDALFIKPKRIVGEIVKNKIAKGMKTSFNLNWKGKWQH